MLYAFSYFFGNSFAVIKRFYLIVSRKLKPGFVYAEAFYSVGILVILALSLVGKLLDKVIQIVMLGWLNKLLGGLFAIAKWVLILSLLVVAFNSINQTFNLVKPGVLAESQLYPILNEIANTIFPYLKNLLKA